MCKLSFSISLSGILVFVNPHAVHELYFPSLAINRYRILREVYAPSFKQHVTPLEACSEVLRQVGVKGWAEGHTKILLKFQHTSQLETRSASIMLHVATIQRCKSGNKEAKKAWGGFPPSLPHRVPVTQAFLLTQAYCHSIIGFNSYHTSFRILWPFLGIIFDAV